MDVKLCCVVFGNELIVARILSFLPFASLKDCRLINQLWFREANASFYSKAVIPIKPPNSEDDSEHRRTHLEFDEIRKLALNKYSQFSLSLMNSDDPYRNDVLSLLEEITNKRRAVPIKYLNVEFCQTLHQIKFVSQILRFTPHLNELRFARSEYHDEIDDELILGVEDVFVDLTTLTIFSEMHIGDFTGENMGKLLSSIVENAPNLTIFKLQYKSSPQLDLATLTTFVKQNPKQLQEIGLSYAEYEMLQLLLKLSATLRVLKIGAIFSKDGVILGQVLSRFENSLEELDVGVGFTIGSAKIPSFVLPGMNNLRILKYRTLDDTRPVYMGWCGNARAAKMSAISFICDSALFDYLNISKILEGGGEQFKSKFPNLTHLELSVHPVLLRERFQDVFFSWKDENVEIPQVKELQLSLSQKQDNEYVDFLQRLIKIFPNVDSLRKEMDTRLLFNEVVVSRILSFLPFDDLKKCRLINNLWFREADSFFYKKTVVKIKPQPISDNDSDTKGYFLDIPMLGLHKCGNFSLWLFNSESYRDKVLSILEGISKYKEGVQVKFLHITFCGTKKHITFVQQILRLSPHLEELRLTYSEVETGHEGEGDDPIFENETSFRELTVLKISGDKPVRDDMVRSLGILLASITRNAPKLKAR